jgi:predicted NAD/FAD-binding protein
MGELLTTKFRQRHVLVAQILGLEALFDIVRFSLFAEDVLQDHHIRSTLHQPEKEPLRATTAKSQIESIREYLSRKNYSEHFITYFLIPMVAAPWRIDPDEFARTFPAESLIQFM